MKEQIIVGKFDKKENFGFLIPEKKSGIRGDFFIALKNSNNAEHGDTVEAIEIQNKKGKSKEAKIVKIIKTLASSNDKSVKELLNEDNIVGVFSQGKGDFGFIDVEGVEKGFFVFSHNKNGSLDGDRVEASVKIFNGKSEAVVERVIERKQELVVGEYLAGKDNRFGFVKPNNPNMKTDVFVAGKNSMEAQTGDVVGIHITKWTAKNPEGTIKEILGKKGDKKIDVLALIVESGTRIKFPEEVISYTEKIKSPLPREEGIEQPQGQRTDLTDLFTFTIDGEDAKDLDDAISIKKIDNGDYKLYVHIADVTHYVKENSLLDKEAYKRATSTYLVDRVIPMLPEVLSNNLCSLNPDTKKLTLTCEMTIGKNGKIKSQKVYNSIISSDFRLTYKEVDEIIGQAQGIALTGECRDAPCGYPKIGSELLFSGKIITKQLTEALQIANELKEKIKGYRESNGVLNFEFPETKIILDDEGNPIGIKEYPRYDSNKLIEEFMISANEAVSKEFADLPFLYRIHDEPKDDDLAKLQETLHLFELDFKFKSGNTKEFSKLLDKIGEQNESKKMFLEKMVLRTLSKAIYSKENFGHFGLGLSFYSHFTSPIRRYPDLQIHRIIKEKLAGKLNSERVAHYEDILINVSEHSSNKERKAEKLEYRVRDYYMVKYYKDKVGQDFEGVITGVIPKGFFVGLTDTAEGFVELSRSEFVEELQLHKDLSNGKAYRLGDSIRVKLIEVDEKLLRLNFEISK